MYTKAELAALKTEFWNAFARYASVQPSLRGRKKLWILHHTKVKGVALKFIVERRHVAVVIELSHNAHHERAEMLERIVPYMEMLQRDIDLPLEIRTETTTEVGKRERRSASTRRVHSTIMYRNSGETTSLSWQSTCISSNATFWR